MAGLVLTRKKGQSIMIEDVEITVEMASNGRAKIRIVADPAVSIMRSELINAEENEANVNKK